MNENRNNPGRGNARRFSASAVQEISTALNAALADIFALYLKTKNFHWHMSGPHFATIICSDEQSEQIFAFDGIASACARSAA